MGNMPWRRLVAGLVFVCAQAGTAGAAGYPEHPVRIVIPTAAGGAFDSIARALAERLAAEWKESVIVDNRPGANGMIAYTNVARAKPDGLTVLLSLSSLIQTSVLYAEPTYRLEDFAPVGLVAYMPSAFAIRSDIPATDFEAFIDYARQQPKLSFGSSGTGSTGHFAGEMLWQQAGVSVLHVPYRGEAPAIQAAMAGQLTAVMGAPGSLSQQAGEGGRLRLMALAAPQRQSAFPDLPTFAELGYPQANLSGWSAALVPRDTPDDIVQDLHAALTRAIRHESVSDRIANYGFEPVASTPAELSAFLKDETQRWQHAVRSTGITVE